MSSPYIPFYTSDFLAGTSGLTAAEKGVYITLLCMMYETESPITVRYQSIARRCGCTLPAFKKALETLCDEQKVQLTHDGIWSEKCEKHLTSRRERSDSARGAAKKRWQKTVKKQCQQNASAMRSACQPEPEPDIKTIAKAISKKPRRKAEVPLPEDWMPPPLPNNFFAKHKNLTLEDIEPEHDKFRNHAIANDRRQRDWNAAWRLWLGNANKWAKPKSKSAEPSYFEREQSDHDRAASAAIASLQRRTFE